MDIDSLSISEVIELYGKILKKLKDDGVIKTRNLVGELGEYMAIDYYCKTKGLPKLQLAPPSTKSIDAISIDGDRYSIKSTTGKTSGVFYGLNAKGSIAPDKQVFEYVIIVSFNENMIINQIIQLDWEQFLKHKKWHSRMSAWNLTITNALIEDSKVIYSALNS
jgi:hypothetical protein